MKLSSWVDNHPKEMSVWEKERKVVTRIGQVWSQRVAIKEKLLMVKMSSKKFKIEIRPLMTPTRVKVLIALARMVITCKRLSVHSGSLGWVLSRRVRQEVKVILLGLHNNTRNKLRLLNGLWIQFDDAHYMTIDNLINKSTVSLIKNVMMSSRMMVIVMNWTTSLMEGGGQVPAIMPSQVSNR